MGASSTACHSYFLLDDSLSNLGQPPFISDVFRPCILCMYILYPLLMSNFAFRGFLCVSLALIIHLFEMGSGARAEVAAPNPRVPMENSTQYFGGALSSRV
jgi:hypothetical protein